VLPISPPYHRSHTIDHISVTTTIKDNASKEIQRQCDTQTHTHCAPKKVTHQTHGDNSIRP